MPSSWTTCVCVCVCILQSYVQVTFKEIIEDNHFCWHEGSLQDDENDDESSKHYLALVVAIHARVYDKQIYVCALLIRGCKDDGDELKYTLDPLRIGNTFQFYDKFRIKEQTDSPWEHRFCLLMPWNRFHFEVSGNFSLLNRTFEEV